MRIGVIGTGRIGGRLARAWTRAGHDVVAGTREPDGERAGEFVREHGIAAGSIDTAARHGDVVVLAVPFAAVEALLPALAPFVSGKVVIDTSNAIVRTPREPGGPPEASLRFPPTSSAVEEIAARLPGARLVKAFNAQGAEIIDQPMFGGERACTFFCGDDVEARRVAAGLIGDIGFDAVDLGPLRLARQLESLTLLWFAASATAGSREIAFRLLRR